MLTWAYGTRAERQHSTCQLSSLRQNTTVLLLPQNTSSWWTEHPQNTSILAQNAHVPLRNTWGTFVERFTTRHVFQDFTVLLTVVEHIRARYCSNAAVFGRVSRRQKFTPTPRTRASSVRRRPDRAVSAGNRYRLCQTSADVVIRESRSRSSGRRPSSQPTTNVRGFNVASGAS